MKSKFFLSLLIFSSIFKVFAGPFPIQFSIPESKMVNSIPQKTRDFAICNPFDRSTYIFDNEKDYYQDYQSSYFAITSKKAGWDCMRHYEILANGCIPYFVDLEKCDPDTMIFLPKDLILEAMNLPGVSLNQIDHSLFDKSRYTEILSKLLAYTKEHLTTKSMAKYLLEKAGYQGSGNILYLSYDLFPDYLRDLSLIGLKELLGNKVVDFPKIPHIYTSYPHDVCNLYGKGMSYSKIIEDDALDRLNISEKIKSGVFDLIIFGSFHRGLPFVELVHQIYPSDKIVYLCGEDLIDPRGIHQCTYSNLNNFFIREFSCLKPNQKDEK